jgi:hypothetical protein
LGALTVRSVVVESKAPNWFEAVHWIDHEPPDAALSNPLSEADGLTSVGVLVEKARSGGPPVAVIVMIEPGSPPPAVAVIVTKAPTVEIRVAGALIEIGLTATARDAGCGDRVTSDSAARAGSDPPSDARTKSASGVRTRSEAERARKQVRVMTPP